MTKIIGITGPSGSGKSLLRQYLDAEGIKTIDADDVYHSMLVPPSSLIDALAGVFGNDIVLDNGELDRCALAKKVFASEDMLSLLNATVLPRVIERIENMVQELYSGEKIVAIDAPTLIESGFHKKCHKVIVVLSSRELRIKRIQARDNISFERAVARIDAQPKDSFYTDVADDVLINDGDISEFEVNIRSVIKKLCSL